MPDELLKLEDILETKASKYSLVVKEMNLIEGPSAPVALSGVLFVGSPKDWNEKPDPGYPVAVSSEGAEEMLRMLLALMEVVASAAPPSPRASLVGAACMAAVSNFRLALKLLKE
jgi:hypothetical protein